MPMHIDPAQRPLLLTLYRHAKAARDNPDLDDFDRPLTARGKRDARRMARWIARELPTIDQALLSPATRTRQTLRRLRKVAGIRRRDVRRDHALYLAPHTRLAARIRLFGAGHHLLVVGHNDGLSRLADWLTGGQTSELPTAGLVHLACHIGEWRELAAGCAEPLSSAWPVRDDDPT